MKKRRTILAGALVCGVLLLAGCGSGSGSADTGSAEEIHYADQDFITDLALGLEARWDDSNAYDAQDEDPAIGSDEQAENFKKFVQDELDKIGKYKDERFENTELQEAALSYINALNDQMDALEYAGVDDDKYYDQWQKAYDERSKLIADFVHDYGLTVGDEYKDDLKDLVTNAQVVEENESQKKAVKKLAKKLKFKLTEDEYGYKTYTAVKKNNSGYDLSDFYVDINLIDSDGVIIDSTYASVQNWKDGTKARFEFTTDEDFEELDITLESWEVAED